MMKIKYILVIVITIFSLLLINKSVSGKAFQESGSFNLLLEEVKNYLREGKINEAMDLLIKLKENFPMNYDIRLFIGLAHYMKKDLEAADGELSKIESTIDLKKRIGGPGYYEKPDTSWELGYPATQKEKFYFSDENLGLLFIVRGMILKQKEDYKQAEKKFLLALKSGYNEQDIRYLLIDTYVNLKDYKRAHENFEKIFSIKKEKNEVDYFIEAYLLYYSGKETEAINLLKKSLEIKPDFLEAKKNEGCILYNKGEYEKSINVWEEALKISPDDLDSKRNIARAYFHLGKVDKAKEEFEKLGIKISPKDYSPKKVPLHFIELDIKIKF